MKLLGLTITTALSATGGTAVQFTHGSPRNVTLEAIFTYGSGGTSADAYVQTSLDGGATWIDIANFHFTTSSLSKVVNLSSLTPVTTLTTPSDGSLSANTVVDGIIGTQIRVKYVSVGTYAGGTTLAVYANSARLQ
jgi:hypothetical protein